MFQKLLDLAKSNKKIRKFPRLPGLIILKIFHLFGLVTLGPYHQRMLVSNCVLNTDRIKETIKWNPIYTNEKMLIECYDNYLENLSISRKSVSSSKKMPNLKIINILKIFNF